MKMEDINYDDFKVTTPYPEVAVTSRDPVISKRIRDAYVGGEGEMTAINQYIYQSFITNPNEVTKHMAHLLMEIAEVEMHHLSILSQILAQMGTDPKFCTFIDNNPKVCNYWTAHNVNYENDIPAFLKYDIKIEHDAIREYQSIRDMAEDPNIKEVIGRIIEDEESHINLFNAMLAAAQG